MTPKHTLKLKMFNAEKLSHAIGVPANGDLTQKQIDSICFNVDRLFSENYDRLKAENEKLRGGLERAQKALNQHYSGGFPSKHEIDLMECINKSLKQDSPC
jgi:hypothetical protein